MTFLTPWSAVIAAALAVPALLLLYFLRLRRQRLRVPSTLLWEKSFEDLQANAPFQRLRWSALLALQLLLLLTLLLALAQPMLPGEVTPASHIVLLMDRSASMNAVIHEAEGAPPSVPSGSDVPARTRLDAAKDEARQIVETLGRGDTASQIMIIAFGSTAQVVTTYESNRGALLDAVDSIQPTDDQTNLDAALQLAGAFAGSRDEREQQQQEVVLLSDGGVTVAGDETGFRLRSGDFRFVQVAPEGSGANNDHSVDNVGIASFSVRREYEDPARVLVFARLLNAGGRAVQAVVTLWIDDQAAATMRVEIPAANGQGPGEATVSQGVDLPGGATLKIRQNHQDDLPADDAAWLVLPAPLRPRIALVHPPSAQADPFLKDLLLAMEPQKVDAMSTDAFANLDASELDSGGLYDLVVFDRVSAARLPGVPSLTIGGVPAPLKATELPEAERPTGRHILSWDRQHPVMRNVSLDTIVYAGFGAYELPSGATPLAFGPDGPVMAVIGTRGARHVAVGFELVNSNWPLHVSSAVFMQNVIDFLTLSRSGANGLAFRAGEPITVRTRREARQLTIDGPIQASMNVEPGAMVTLPALRKAGLYTVSGAAAPYEAIAVNVLSDLESDIRPRSEVKVNAEQAAGGDGGRGRAVAAHPLWPWLVAAAFALMVAEWLVYCRLARG